MNSIPFNLEAEKACLGALFIKESVSDEIFSVVKPYDFYDNRHQIIAQAILSLKEKFSGRTIDIVTLAELLKSENKLDAAGGIATIQQLLDAVPTTANAWAYADIVHKKAILRRLMEVGSEIVGSAQKTDISPENALGAAEQMLFDISKEEYSDYTKLDSALHLTVEEMQKNYNNKGSAIGIETGYIDLDNLISGFHKGNLIIIGGRPSMGKTAFAISLLMNLAINRSNRVGVGFFSLEMSKIEICQRMICAQARVPADKIRKNALIESDWPKLISALDSMKDGSVFIDDSATSLHEIRSKSKRMVREGAGIIFIDYLTLMEAPPEMGKQANREQAISAISRSLKRMARELEVPVVALAQLNRATESRTDKRPILSDIRESGSIEQDADIVAFVHRQSYYERDNEEIKNDGEIVVAKNRHGATGIVPLIFNGQFGRFENKERHT